MHFGASETAQSWAFYLMGVAWMTLGVPEPPTLYSRVCVFMVVETDGFIKSSPKGPWEISPSP